MRRYDEPIEVRSGEVGGGGIGPVQFLWRRRLWKVLGVETSWKETADWWSLSSVEGRSLSSVEGWSLSSVEGRSRPEPSAGGGGGDLLAESQVWRVVAAAGRTGEPGVYELVRPAAGGDWLLRGVVD